MKDPIISSELHPNPETKNEPTGVWSSQKKEAYILTNNEPYAIGITSITYDEDKQYYVGDNVELTIVVEEGHTLDLVRYDDDDYSGDFVEDPAGTFKGTITLTEVVNVIEVNAKKEASILTNNDPYSTGITSITYEDKQYYVGDNVELTIVVEEGHTLDSVLYDDGDHPDDYSGDFVEDPAGTFKGTITLTRVENVIIVNVKVAN